MGVDAGADRRAADRQLGEMRQHRFDPLDRQTDLARPAADLLTEEHRRGVHQMRTASFDDALRFFCPAVEGGFEVVEGRNQVLDDLKIGRDMNRGRNDIVARLAHVDVVVRVHRVTATRQLGGAAGDDLIRVHVGRGAGAGLEDVERELGVPALHRRLRAAAVSINSYLAASSRPSSRLTFAQAALIKPIARRKEREKRGPLIGKFSIARAVVAP